MESRTIRADEIMQVTGRTVTVLSRVDEEDIPPDTRKTTQGTKSRRTTTNDDGIVVRVGHTGLLARLDSRTENLAREGEDTETEA